MLAPTAVSSYLLLFEADLEYEVLGPDSQSEEGEALKLRAVREFVAAHKLCLQIDGTGEWLDKGPGSFELLFLFNGERLFQKAQGDGWKQIEGGIPTYFGLLLAILALGELAEWLDVLSQVREVSKEKVEEGQISVSSTWLTPPWPTASRVGGLQRCEVTCRDYNAQIRIETPG